jgi:tetratricopeptide (TPR) repeat protein
MLPLGDFRIVRVIGRGGMGIVYEAEQMSLGRRVALKVLPFAAALDDKHLQRFKNEAQAAASLHHQNIVPVYFVGCDRGVHYYAMQFIDGRTLAAMIADLRQFAGLGEEETGHADKPVHGSTQLAAAGSEQKENVSITFAPGTDSAAATPVPANLPTERSITSHGYFRTVANLGVQAAEALEHAHQMGVVHRDIKPANLLVDGRGNLWITDFGLAQIQEDTRLTRTGDLLGTLRYMSPDQALGKRLPLDPRTDVYSLGVTLYEMLTLQPVFGGKNRQELLQQITFDEPSPPRRLNPAIPGDLETIVLKACAKNANERYASAHELAQDLRRFLEDRPIHARRPTLIQRTRKWTRRHRPMVMAGTLVCAAAILIAGGNYVWLGRKQGEAVRAVRDIMERAQVLQTQVKWPEALEVALRAEDLPQLADCRADQKQRLQDLLRDLRLVVRLNEVRLGGTAVQHDRFDNALADEQYRLAFRENYGMDMDALSVTEAVQALLSRPREVREELAAALDAWAHVRKLNAPSDPQSWKHLLAITAAADADPLRNRLRETAAQAPMDRKALADLAASGDVVALPPRSLCFLGDELLKCGAIDKAVELLRQMQQKHPADFWINNQLANYCTRTKPPQWGEALRFFSAALAIQPQSPGAHLNVGFALANLGKFTEAAQEYQEALHLKPDYAGAHWNLANVWFRLGKRRQAMAEYREAIRLRPDKSAIHYDLAIALNVQGHKPGAVAEYREAIRLQPSHAKAHCNLGNLLGELGDPKAAMAEYQEAIRNDPGLFEAHDNLGGALGRQGRLVEGEAEHRKAIALEADQANPHYNLAVNLEAQKKTPQAIAEYREALRLRPEYAEAHCNLGLLLEEQGKLVEAMDEYLAAIKGNPKFPNAHMCLGRVCAKLGQWQKGVAHLSKTLDLKADYPRARFNRAYALAVLGNWDEAAADLAPGGIEAEPLTDVYFQIACLRLLADDRSGYRHVRKQTLEHVRTAKGVPASDPAFLAGRTCAVCPEGDCDPAQIVRWAEQAFDRHPKAPWRLMNLGLAYYRAGHWEEAVRCCRESVAHGPRWNGVVLNWPVLAMALHRLGKTDEARQYLQKAAQWRAGVTQADRRQKGLIYPPSVWLSDWLAFQLLFREAEALTTRVTRVFEPADDLP